MALPVAVTIREVGPRDGLQSQSEILTVEEKIGLVKALILSGVKDIEVTSFVHPRAVPQLADAEELIAGLRAGCFSSVRFSALTGNLRGLARAASSGIAQAVVVISASEMHNLANVKKTLAESLQELEQMKSLARERGTALRGAVATAFGCPYQGDVSKDQVKRVIDGMLKAGIEEITLADTAGLSSAQQVRNLVRFVTAAYPGVRFVLHFHNARGQALENCLAGLEEGIETLESAVGGLGGCPFIPGAAGNVATEDLVRMLHAKGVATGINLAELMQCKSYLQEVLVRKKRGQK